MAERDETRAFVERAGQGDAAAVDALLARHWDGLAAFLRRRAGAGLMAQESGADLAQSVCRELLERLRDGRFDYRGEAAFKQWLYQAALLKLRDRRDFHGAARREAGRRVGESAAEGVAASDPTPSQQAVARERAAEVVAALAKLPPESRRVIELARFEGKSHAEIAAELGITVAASRQLLSRALARLAALR
ncbi:MAG: sigma-70 family RNA polymerase sigma factor [Planctomycetes bacterium]|nr:sigma-70 family RNA polymerase sigma factor [Planctomycetota bacterium]